MSTTHLYPYLPLELFLPIADYLPTRELSSLSRTCSLYHVLLAPRLDTRFKDHARTILSWAAKRNNPEVFKRAVDLVERPPPYSSPEKKGDWLNSFLGRAIHVGRTEFVRAMVGYGVNLHECCGVGTPLSIAVKLGNLEIATLLLEAGTDPDRPGCACEGFKTPAEIAWDLLGPSNMMALLVKYGAAFRPPHLSPGE